MTRKLEERRRSKRIGLEAPVILENATGVTRDVSRLGVFFWKRGVFAYGDSIRFSIERPNGSGKVMQKCRGAVVRTEPRGDDVGVAVNIIESATEPVPKEPGGAALTIEPVASEAGGTATVMELAPSEPSGSAPAVEPVQNEASGAARAIESMPHEPVGTAPPMEPVANEPTTTAPAIEPLSEKPSGSVPATEPVPNQSSGTAPVTAPPGPSTDTSEQRSELPASVIETVKRWSVLLRAKAFEAREELQGQEVLVWHIPSVPETRIAQSRRVTVCSVTVDGLASNVSWVLARNGMRGGSLQAMERLVSNREADVSRNAAASELGMTTDSVSSSTPNDRGGVRIELTIHVVETSTGRGKPQKAPVPKIVIGMAPEPGGDRQRDLREDYSPQKSYSDPTKAFEAFLALAVESAILMNLDPHQ